MPTSSARSSRRAGYTLAELLIVLVIIGLTLALVAPRLFFTSDAAKLDRAVRGFESAARSARASARLTGRDVLMTVHLDDGVVAALGVEPEVGVLAAVAVVVVAFLGGRVLLVGVLGVLLLGLTRVLRVLLLGLARVLDGLRPLLA